jgi:hypothetical protein
MRILLLIALGNFWFAPADAACHNKRTQSACAAAKACRWDHDKSQCY